MKQILILLLFVPVLVWADNDVNVQAQITQLESASLRVQQEAQSTYQQFQMIQELRRSEANEMQIPEMPVSSTLPGGSVKSMPAPNYDELVKKRQERQERINRYAADLDRLYARYRELEERRQTLTEEIDLLKQLPGE